MKKILILICLLFILAGCEREGIINIDDCRETIKITEDSYQTYYKTFACTYDKSDKNNVILGGVCMNVKTNWFGGKCETSYIYEKQPTKKCLKDEYLAQSGDCKCLTGVSRNNKCVSFDEACRLSYGDNVQGAEILNDENNVDCNCKSGYLWNDDKTKCISLEESRKKECDDYFANSIEDYKIKLNNNKTAIEIMRENCLVLLESEVIDFDGDGESEIAMITSGAGCGSCHVQELFIIKKDKKIFYSLGEDFIIQPAKDFIGFKIKTPIRKEGEPYCCPSEGIVMSFKIKKDGKELDTFYKFKEQKESYNSNILNDLQYPDYIIKYNISKYDDNVKKIQSILNLEYKYDLEVDGYFGDETLSAVFDFQEKNSLTKSGWIDKETWDKIFKN